jgi:hypothetical protein
MGRAHPLRLCYEGQLRAFSDDAICTLVAHNPIWVSPLVCHGISASQRGTSSCPFGKMKCARRAPMTSRPAIDWLSSSDVFGP